jgi:mannose-6-phosphate isomerase-like protein (cupin superfamily)
MTADALDDTHSRHWCVVAGACRVNYSPTCKKKTLAVGDAFSLPSGSAVFVENSGRDSLHIIETETSV